jgi:oxygen-dependent protoporphyrinogen oxidase
MQELTPRRVIVVGGGIAGLAAAWRLQTSFHSSQIPLNLLLMEASPQTGGVLKSALREGFLLEMGPDCFISEKPRGIGLCRELGLEAELIGTRKDFRRSFILRNGKFHPVPEGFYLMGPSKTRPFLESGLLTWRGKLRAMCEPLIPSRPLSDESLASFVRRRFGQELLDWMAQPLVAGIYGANPEHLSLRATFPKFLELERTYGSVVFGLKKRSSQATGQASGARYSLFVSLRHGVQHLADTLASKIGSTLIRTQTRVKEVRPSDGVWHVVKASGEVLVADAVCLALPSYAAAELTRTFDPDLTTELSAIDYAPAATVNYAFREMDVKRPLGGVGFVVPQKEKRLVLGCTLVQNKFEGRVPKGFILMRAFLGGENGPAWVHESDESLTNKVFAELKEWLGIAGKPLFAQIARYERALPQYSLGHLERVLRMEERMFRHKGLALAGNYQHGVGIPDSIESGERAADQLFKQMTSEVTLSRAG